MAVQSFLSAKENICWGCCFFSKQISQQFRKTVNISREQEGFITLDFYVVATLLLKPRFPQKQGLECHPLRGDAGLLLNRLADGKANLTAGADPHSSGPVARRAAGTGPGTGWVWREVSGTSSFTNTIPHGTRLSDHPPPPTPEAGGTGEGLFS